MVMLVMYRPVQPTTQGSSVKSTFFSQRNYDTLQTVLAQDFQRRNSAPLNDQQIERLNKTLNHYLQQVYSANGDRQPIQALNKEVLTACAQDFSKYIQRKDAVRNNTVAPIKTVMDESLFQEVGQRYERLTQERNEVKALPPAVPDFRIALGEDGPPPAELYEMAKKHRELEALRAAHNNTEMMKSTMGMQNYVSSDSSFKVLQDAQNRNSEIALYERQNRPRDTTNDMPLVVMPDRRELMLAPIGSFDTLTQSPMPRELGNANSNPTIVQPEFASPMKNDLPQNYVVREEKIVSYKEVENNLFIYSADRDWLRNNKENRYNFTVSFDPASNGQNFGPNPGVQEKFKNIVRIEFIKAIMPGEGLDVTINHSGSSSTAGWDTSFQENILSFPYVSVRIAELENNNFGTDNFLDRSFGVLQYDANWVTDTTQPNTRGYLAMIPKFLKCEKVYHPTPLSTLQKMTIDIHRPNGELISNSPDTFDISAILNSSWTGGGGGAAFPYNFAVNTFSNYGSTDTGGINYFFINTTKFFSRFQVSAGDKIQINGFTYDDATLSLFANSGLADFVKWINRNEGHTVISTAYTSSTAGPLGTGAYNDVGYANFIIIQARYNDPSTGSTALLPFSGMAAGITDILYVNQSTLQSPRRLIDLNKQLTLVFRVITREMDALPQLRPDNNY